MRDLSKPDPAAAPREIELKLNLDPARAADLLESPILRRHRVGASTRAAAVSVYFDFPDGALARAGYTLRVRSSGPDSLGGHLQTCKRTTGASGVMNDRAEWNHPLANGEPDLALVRRESPDLQRLVGRRRNASLRPLYASHIDRVALDLALEDGALVELCLDRGTVEASGRAEPVCQIELELKRGPATALFDLALELHKRTPMEVTLDTKSALGERLRTGAAPGPARAEPPTLGPETLVGEAFRAVASEALGQLIANQPCALGADSVEGVHQMRVAIRRLRSAFVLFLPNALPGSQARRLQADLRRRATLLGALRDWDVLATSTLPRARKHGASATAVEDLARALEPPRAAARIEVERMLRSPDHTKRMLRLARWLETAPTLGDIGWAMPPHARLGVCVAALLERLRADVLVRGHAFESLSEEGRHEVRKAAKKLRYGIGFLATLFQPSELKPYVKPLERLQEELGRLNDLATTHALFATLKRGGVATAAEVEAAVLRHTRNRVATITGEWEAFAAAKPFWL